MKMTIEKLRAAGEINCQPRKDAKIAKKSYAFSGLCALCVLSRLVLPAALTVLAPLLALLLAAGCSHAPSHDVYAGMPGSVFAPQPPPFLRSSMGLLFTNVSGFSARIAQEPPPMREHPEEVSGQLWALNGKLLFAPDPPKKKRKHHIEPGLSFIWDVSQGSGFILSEALQAYAPVSSSSRFTNILVQPASQPSKKIDGYAARQEVVTFTTGDGVSSTYEVWRAAELRDLPVQIVSTNMGRQEVTSLSKVQLAPPPREVFSPPSSFTRYGSVEDMMTELVIREQGLKGNSVGGWHKAEPLESETPPQR